MESADLIPIRTLAEELGVRSSAIDPLIEIGYIQIENPNRRPENMRLIRRPPPAAMAWLYTRFHPGAKWKNMLPMDVVASELKLTPDRVRGYCLSYGIQIYLYPPFGEMIMLQGFDRLYAELAEEESVVRTDRQMFVFMLAKRREELEAGEIRALTPQKFSKRIEREIARIIAMPDPHRTLAAAKLWKSFADADAFAGAVNGVDKVDAGPLMNEMREQMSAIERVLAGKRTWANRIAPKRAPKKANGVVVADVPSSDV